MEILKIVGGLAAIAVLVVVIGVDRDGGATETAAAAASPPARTFAAGDSSARFIVPESAPAETASGEAVPQD